MAGSVCLVTVHGIGFQRAAADDRDIAGYADQLHAHLSEPLRDLGDDPQRPSGGPVYVSSEWNGRPADGLARLAPDAPLAPPGKVAHVALVYSASEYKGAYLGETAGALARAAAAHHQYASATGIVRLLFSDAWAALHETSEGNATSTLIPRSDLHHEGLFSHLLRRHDQDSDQVAPPTPVGAGGMLRALEDDVATYVARNELRERVRVFVQDALLALLDRDDVAAIVLNAHSQGTVLCWDVLCRLPFASWVRKNDACARRIPHFVTAGSPIRKYVRMFAWGNRVGELAEVLPTGAMTWTNFCDPHDPVADPLNPPENWRPGQAWGAPTDPHGGLLVARNYEDGFLHHVTVADEEVDNVHHSAGGGLQAHDYWNNTREFVPRLAKLIEGARTLNR